MARCPLCESDVPDGRSACDICGQPFDRGLTARAAPDITKRAIAAARKDLAASSRDPADPAFARNLLERAEQTEAAADLGRALDLARASRRVPETAGRKPRVPEAPACADADLEGAETILDRAAADVEAARRDGVNIAEARKVLTQARDALRRGVYADIPVLAQRARGSLQEARRYAVADVGLRESAREAARERRKGVDVSGAEAILDDAGKALAAKEYGRGRALAKDAHDAVRHASRLPTVRDAFASLQVDAEDLRDLGADAADLEQILVDLTKAVEARDLQAARRLVGRARHAAESARDSHFRAIMAQSLQIILLNAARGLDPSLARHPLINLDDPGLLRNKLNMQALIDKRMADADAETESKLNMRVLQARDDIVALRQGGQNDTVGLEGKLADAAIGIQERRFFHADALLDNVEHDIFATRELMRSSAAEVLGQARGEVARAKA